MRKTLLIGLAVLVAGVLVLMLSSGLDLELESTALMGVAIGAVLALVPDRSAVMRIAGFLAGFAAAWIGYLVRAGYLPDTDHEYAECVQIAKAEPADEALKAPVSHRAPHLRRRTPPAAVPARHR